MSGWGVGGRPRIHVARRLEDYPPPNPQPTPCILWEGAVDRNDYGLVQVDRKRMRAHRWVWEAKFGPIPEGQVVRHKCDNPPCINTDHLELGTIADNNRDARERNHVGSPPILAPSEVRRLVAEREAGRTYKAIFDDWPELHGRVRSIRTLSNAVKRAERDGLDGLSPVAPEGYHRERPPWKRNKVTPYGGWRERGPGGHTAAG